MDPNANNPGSAPPGTDPGTDPGRTQYFPPQDSYRAQDLSAQATQPVQSVPPLPPLPSTPPGPPLPPGEQPAHQISYAQQPYQLYTQTPVSPQPAPPPTTPAPGSPYSWNSWTAGRNDRDRSVLALVLIVGGVLFLTGQIAPFFGFGDLVLVLLGGVLLYGYWSTRSGHRIAFLIPGAILFGLGVGQLLSNFPFAGYWTGGDLTTLGLGLGFCLIWALERKHWWALFPGLILILVSLSSISMIGNLWPLALIALGAYMLYGQ